MNFFIMAATRGDVPKPLLTLGNHAEEVGIFMHAVLMIFLGGFVQKLSIARWNWTLKEWQILMKLMLMFLQIPSLSKH
jgi:hypothetical protein